MAIGMQEKMLMLPSNYATVDHELLADLAPRFSAYLAAQFADTTLLGQGIYFPGMLDFRAIFLIRHLGNSHLDHLRYAL